MKQRIAYITLVVKEYDESIDFYTKKLDSKLLEDTNKVPHHGDFNTAMCRLNRWTIAKNKHTSDKVNREYHNIANYLLDSKITFEPKSIQNLENHWLTAFTNKNSEKAIAATG